MLFAKLAATFAFVPFLVTGAPVAEVVAQNNTPYADWIFLYEDSFENSSGQEVSQQWWLEPGSARQGNLTNFTLLARRSPVSSNGTAAAVFDYVANCDTMSYTVERTEFLDSSDASIDVQTFQKVMEPANPDDEFYGVLDNICNGAY